MSKFSCLSAAAAVALAATAGTANAQATNMSPYSGEARAYYGNGSDVPGWNHRAMQRRGYYVHDGYAVRPYGWHGGYYHPYGRTEGIPPALYHAGDPAYWR